MHGSKRHRHTVYPALRVRADVRLHAKIPGIALLRLFHLRVSLMLLILRRTRRTDDAGVHNRPFMQQQTPLRQIALSQPEQRLRQPVCLQKVTELQYRRLIRYRLQIHPRKPVHQLHAI